MAIRRSIYASDEVKKSSRPAIMASAAIVRPSFPSLTLIRMSALAAQVKLVALLIIWRRYLQAIWRKLGRAGIGRVVVGGPSALSRFRLLEPHFENDRPLRVIATEAGVPYQRCNAGQRNTGSSALWHSHGGCATIAEYAGQYR